MFNIGKNIGTLAADTWSGNTGSVSYPVGICGSGAPDIMVTFTATQPLSPAGGSPARFPTMVVGTFPGSPLSLASNGFGGYEGTVALPLGGSYTYAYHDGFGPVEPCQPSWLMSNCPSTYSREPSSENCMLHRAPRSRSTVSSGAPEAASHRTIVPLPDPT